MTPLPPMLPETSPTAGPLRSTGITPLQRYFGPLRLPLAVNRFPGDAGYAADLLRRFLVGARRVSPVAQRVLVTMPSITTPPKYPIASVTSRCCMLPSPSH